MVLCSALLALGLPACSGSGEGGQEPPKPVVVKKKAPLGKNVFLETEGDKRRVLVEATVCLREGGLEQFLTCKGLKAHEAILTADVDARDIHLALVAARAEPGHPVRFRPQFEAATGTTIKVFVEYQNKGQTVRVPAQSWIRSAKTKKDLAMDWVFAGSSLDPNPFDKTKPPYYAANFGDVICVSNFDTAMMDLPINSPKDNDDLSFQAHTERIPDLKTPVLVILDPVLPEKKK